MERSEMLAWFEERGIVPEVKTYGFSRVVEPSVHTCSVCGGYKSIYLPGSGGHHVDPELAFAYAAYEDELREAAGLTPYRQLDRGPCTCDHEHVWVFVRNLGTCYNRYQCEVCKVINDVDSSG